MTEITGITGIWHIQLHCVLFFLVRVEYEAASVSCDVIKRYLLLNIDTTTSFTDLRTTCQHIVNTPALGIIYFVLFKLIFYILNYQSIIKFWMQYSWNLIWEELSLWIPAIYRIKLNGYTTYSFSDGQCNEQLVQRSVGPTAQPAERKWTDQQTETHTHGHYQKYYLLN